MGNGQGSIETSLSKNNQVMVEFIEQFAVEPFKPSTALYNLYGPLQPSQPSKICFENYLIRFGHVEGSSARGKVLCL